MVNELDFIAYVFLAIVGLTVGIRLYDHIHHNIPISEMFDKWSWLRLIGLALLGFYLLLSD